MMGDLTDVDAGFETPLGTFSNTVKASGVNGTVTQMQFSTPKGTTGSVSLPGVVGKLVCNGSPSVTLVNGEATGLQGGDWTCRFRGERNFRIASHVDMSLFWMLSTSVYLDHKAGPFP